MQFFEHNIENVRIEQQRHSEDEASCQAEDVVAVEVVVVVDAVVVAGLTVGQDKGIAEVTMTTVATMGTTMKMKERRCLSLTLLESNMSTRVIRQKSRQ